MIFVSYVLRLLEYWCFEISSQNPNFEFEPKMQRMLENNVQNAMEQMRRKMVKDVKWEQESALLKVGFE